MRVIFYGNREGNFLDSLIRWWTSPLIEKINGKWRDSYSHVELLFSDGMMFSASQYENSTRFKKFNGGSAWKILDISTHAHEEFNVRDFCTSEDNKPYDYKGVLGFISPLQHSKDKWFCSEIGTAGLQRAWKCMGLTPSTTSPNKLYRYLTKGD